MTTSWGARADGTQDTDGGAVPGGQVERVRSRGAHRERAAQGQEHHGRAGFGPCRRLEEVVEVNAASYSVRLSTMHKGRKRREPVWIGRYRVGGHDSAKVLG